MMAAMEILIIIFSVICVQAQQPIVDRTEFMDGVPITVTCDVSRFTATEIPTAVTTITELSIERTVGTNAKTVIATYIPYPGFPGASNLTINITSGRNWTVDAIGGVAPGSPPNNRASIKLTLTIRDSKCESDTAIYKCAATYFQSGTTKVDRSLNVTGKASPVDHVITLIDAKHNGNDPQVSTNQIGLNVSLNCRVRAPYGSQLVWLGNLPGADIQTTTPSPPTTPLPCARYDYESLLNNMDVQLGETTYFCVVNDARGVEISRMNFTIVGSPSTQEPDKGNVEAPAEANVGAIVGGVIGGLVLIAIIVIVVYFCWYRKRNDDDSGRDKEVENTNTTHAPPPVFYAEPKKAKKDERDGVRPDKGFTNEALDNSYDDSKDHRGPPQYINTVDGEDLPRYEQETHRGRSNKGYEDENEKNEGHGRRHRRDRKDKEDRNDRKPPRKDYEDRDRGRHYSTDDGTDNRDPQVGFGDPNMGTSI